MVAIASGDDASGWLVIRLSPGTNFNLRTDWSRDNRNFGQVRHHEQPGMLPEPALLKGRGYPSRGMQQQLRLCAVNTRGLLKSLDRVLQEPRFDIFSAGRIRPVSDEQIANDALARFVDKERIAQHPAPIHRRIARQNLRIQ